MSYKRAVVSSLRFYCRHSPITAGKARLEGLGRRFLDGVSVEAHSRDGLQFHLSFPHDWGWESVVFRGTFESGTTAVMRSLLRDDSVVFDIGANIGWYTVHAAAVATSGSCHAFEPVPRTFEALERNCVLNDLGDRVVLNRTALGEIEDSTADVHVFHGLPHGHSSLSTLGRSDFDTCQVPVMTLDRYIERNAITAIDLIKMDVEGAEMLVLKGGRAVCAMDPPPMWIIEMNEETSVSFGYKPADLLRFLERHEDYVFYTIAQAWGAVVPMASVDKYRHGDNVLCVPRHRLDVLDALTK